MSEPIAYAEQWRAVMEAAGYRCECVGQCGSQHVKGRGRCQREHDQLAGKQRGPVRLMAAPLDLNLPPTRAAALPPSELRAWCVDCHTDARRAATRAAPAPVVDGLFDL
ncbi:hypothetical protein [Streptomyces sp. NPDC003077]|uniref:hypothetical protein n=1 Tax=Streptomyces sp. NPDC003077 TaxID=3154443 RepID=UPI00339FA9D5